MKLLSVIQQEIKHDFLILFVIIIKSQKLYNIFKKKRRKSCKSCRIENIVNNQNQIFMHQVVYTNYFGQ